MSFVPDTPDHAFEIHLLYTGNHYDSLIPQPVQSSLPISPTQHHQSITNNTERTIRATENPYTLVDTTQPIPFPSPNKSNTINFGTWNTRGINQSQKRNKIDSILSKNGIDICSIQEINMGSGTCSSENYTWFLSNCPTTKRRGVGILVRKKSSISIRRVKHYYGSIITLVGHTPNLGEILFISTYVPPQTSHYNRQRSSKIFSTLFSILDRCPKSRDLILFGDFNAHLGADDPWDPTIIGPKLHHNTSNENGISLGLLASSANLFVQTTTGRRIPIYTWTDGHRQTQVDHILTRQKPHSLYTNSIKADTFHPEISDHCLIWITCTPRKQAISSTTTRPPHHTKTTPTSASYNFKNINLGLLRIDNTKTEFQKQLSTIYDNAIQAQESKNHWQTIIDSFKTSAQKVLNSKTPLTPKRRRALAAFKSARHYKNRHPQDPNAHASFIKTKKSLTQAYHEHRSLECQEFFNNLTDYKPSDRIRKTYQYFKNYKRENNISTGAYIPISSWLRELKKSESTWPPLSMNVIMAH